MREDFARTNSGLRKVYYRDREIIGHNCFTEEQVEAEFENYLINPMASYLKYAFPLVKRIWASSENKYHKGLGHIPVPYSNYEGSNDGTSRAGYIEKKAPSRRKTGFQLWDIVLD